MNFKKIATTIELLAITSVVSVGFSAWAIVETTSPTVTATIETENVINNNEYLTIKNVIFSDYKYSDTASDRVFYPDFNYSNTSRTQAKLFAQIDINLTRWKELIGTTTYANLVFSLDVSISSGSVNSWLGEPATSHKYSGSNTINNNKLTTSSDGWSENFSVPYNLSLSTMTIDLEYIFTLGTSDTDAANTESLINYLNNMNGKGFQVQFLAEMRGGN